MTLIYIMKGSQTLFLKRAIKPEDYHSVDKYFGVGGKVDLSDKSIYDSACREMLEETNLVANKLIKKGVVKIIGQRQYPVEITVYSCDDYYGELKGDLREGTLHWIDNDKIEELNLWDGDRYWLNKIFEVGEFEISLTYKNTKLIKVNNQRIND